MIGEWQTLSKKDKLRMSEIEDSDGEKLDYLKYKVDMVSNDISIKI